MAAFFTFRGISSKETTVRFSSLYNSYKRISPVRSYILVDSTISRLSNSFALGMGVVSITTLANATSANDTNNPSIKSILTTRRKRDFLPLTFIVRIYIVFMFLATTQYVIAHTLVEKRKIVVVKEIFFWMYTFVEVVKSF